MYIYPGDLTKACKPLPSYRRCCFMVMYICTTKLEPVLQTGFVINRMAELELRKPLQRYSIQVSKNVVCAA